VRMFKGQTKGEYLIEMQRRSGCCVSFRKVTSQVFERFTQKGKHEKVKILPQAPSWGVVILDDATADVLAAMLSLSKSDQQQESLRLLADASASSDNHGKIISAVGGLGKLGGSLLEALTSGDRQFERYASVLLANLCCSQSDYQLDIQKLIVNRMFDPLCALLRLDSLGSLETKRQIHRCVTSLPAEARKRYFDAIQGPIAVQGKDLASSVRNSFGRLLQVQ